MLNKCYVSKSICALNSFIQFILDSEEKNVDPFTPLDWTMPVCEPSPRLSRLLGVPGEIEAKDDKPELEQTNQETEKASSSYKSGTTNQRNQTRQAWRI